MVSYLLSLIIGVGTGVVASHIYLSVYLKRKKPKIVISKYISKVEKDGETNYVFKFINNTKCEIYDVNVEVDLLKPIGDIQGRNLKKESISLKGGSISYIPPKKKNDNRNLHAIRVRTTDDLLSKWSDDSSYLIITIIAKHSFSGFNRVIQQEYLTKDCIKVGKVFQSGDDLNVY